MIDGVKRPAEVYKDSSGVHLLGPRSLAPQPLRLYEAPREDTLHELAQGGGERDGPGAVAGFRGLNSGIIAPGAKKGAQCLRPESCSSRSAASAYRAAWWVARVTERQAGSRDDPIVLYNHFKGK